MRQLTIFKAALRIINAQLHLRNESHVVFQIDQCISSVLHTLRNNIAHSICLNSAPDCMKPFYPIEVRKLESKVIVTSKWDWKF